MLRKAQFRVEFKVSECRGKDVCMVEYLPLPCRTEETHMNRSSTVYRAAERCITDILHAKVEIRHINIVFIARRGVTL